VVEADSNLLPLIRTDVRGDTLNIDRPTAPTAANHPVHVIYTVPRLSDLRQNGSGRVSVQDLNGGPLTVRRAGRAWCCCPGQVASLDADATARAASTRRLQSASANLTLNGSGRVVGQVRGDYAIVNLNGSGQLHASGAVRSLTARANGSGHLDLADLSASRPTCRRTARAA
jgi:hypothetical protein